MMSETSRFTEDILTSAKSKADAIIREAEAETQRASDEARGAISREAEAIIRNAKAEADATKRREVSEARHLSKIREQREKDKIMLDVMDRAKKRVLETIGDDAKYIPMLTRLIESGIHELGEKSAMIHLNERDLRNISSLELRVNKTLTGDVKVEVSKRPIEASGGAVISSQNGKIRMVNTLDQRFEALESKLLVEARKSLFGQ